ncbi:MAG: hypothetical protein D4R76_04565 [Methylococcus sp.]|nr:MAG: hypothetical protein D4R76_04565 [Methylococcus sp.]
MAVKALNEFRRAIKKAVTPLLLGGYRLSVFSWNYDLVEVASIKRTLNCPQNQWLKNAIKDVAPKVAPKNIRLVKTF